MKLHTIYYLLLFGLAISSCSEDRDPIELELAKSGRTKVDHVFSQLFEKEFGSIADDVSWTMVSEIAAEISIDGINNIQNICVYTTDPRMMREDCFLLAKYSIQASKTSINYDYPSGLENVYIAAINAEGKGYLKRISTSRNANITFLESDISFDNSKLSIPPISYRIGYETFLEGEPDFDYNDVVVELRYVRGTGDASVKLLAAGCSIPAQVCFQEDDSYVNKNLTVLFEEVHESFGYPPYYDMAKDRLVYDIFNTGLNPVKKFPAVSFSLSDSEMSAARIIPRLKAIFLPEEKHPQISYVPIELGSKYPEAICVSYPYWTWPVEEEQLSGAYPIFKNFVSSGKGGLYWFDGVWEKANYLENSDIGSNCAYGRKLSYIDGYVPNDQLLPFANYNCILTIKVSGTSESSQLKLCKYPNTTIMYVATIETNKDGLYTLAVSARDMSAITDTRVYGDPTGLQITPDGCVIEDVYIR